MLRDDLRRLAEGLTVAVIWAGGAIGDGTNWTEQAKLTPADAGNSDWFGESTAINGAYAIAGARMFSAALRGGRSLC